MRCIGLGHGFGFGFGRACSVCMNLIFIPETDSLALVNGFELHVRECRKCQRIEQLSQPGTSSTSHTNQHLTFKMLMGDIFSAEVFL